MAKKKKKKNNTKMINNINKNNNNKKKRIFRTEFLESTKHSDKLIYDAELGIDVNTLIEKNLTIADLEGFSTDEPSDLNKLEPSTKIFIPISDFLTSEACEKLFPENSGLSEVACTSIEPEPTFEAYLDFNSEAITKESNLDVATEHSILDTNESFDNSSLETTKNNTVISFPVDNAALLEREAERQKRELDMYLEEEAKFKEFDKKLITLTREKLAQKKQSNFSKFLNKLFV